MKKYVTEQEVAERLSVHVQTLRNWRHQGRELPYLKIGRAVRYDVEEVERYMENCKVEPW